MQATEIRIARRVATYMLEVAQQQTDMSFFMGLGFALAVIFEEATGKSAKNLKPKEIIEWATALPDVSYPRVTLT